MNVRARDQFNIAGLENQGLELTILSWRKHSPSWKCFPLGKNDALCAVFAPNTQWHLRLRVKIPPRLISTTQYNCEENTHPLKNFYYLVKMIHYVRYSLRIPRDICDRGWKSRSGWLVQPNTLLREGKTPSKWIWLKHQNYHHNCGKTS